MTITSPRHLLAWSSPPQTTTVDDQLAELQRRPGEWALVHVGVSHHVTTWKARGCRARSQTIYGQVHTWAMWPAAAGDADVLEAEARRLDLAARELHDAADEARAREAAA